MLSAQGWQTLPALLHSSGMSQLKPIHINRALLSAAALCLTAAFLVGCEEPLFTSDLPRTQYERYDRLRGRYVPMEQMTARGHAEPSLRDRLSPR